MIKNIEQLNKEELQFVKTAFENYLNGVDDELPYLNKGIKKVNSQLAKNNKEYKRILNKIIDIDEKGTKKDNFWTIIGVLLSGLTAAGLSYTTDEILLIMGVFGVGTIASFVIPEIEVQTRKNRLHNKFVDLEVIDKENRKLKEVSSEVNDVIEYVDNIKSFVK